MPEWLVNFIAGFMGVIFPLAFGMLVWLLQLTLGIKNRLDQISPPDRPGKP